ncbi:hypothetical protein [secondary endosymbiont of Ctenarytaina eucalypti]|nr:hypothetical protein [secondary endosymbiont of Ctenarytaina eucalypti]
MAITLILSLNRFIRVVDKNEKGADMLPLRFANARGAYVVSFRAIATIG